MCSALAETGVLPVGGAGRRTSLQQSRLRSGGQRFSRLRWLSRVCYKAMRTGRTNPYAAAFRVCEVLGVAPTQLRRFRSQAAAATGMTQAQRCATTAIEIVFGMDLALDVLRRHLGSFLGYANRLYMAMAAVPGRIRVAWRAAKENPGHRRCQVGHGKWTYWCPHCPAL